MIFSRSTFGESAPASTTKPPRARPLPAYDEGADPPRWGLLAAAIVAALVTAAWIGSAFATAQAAAAQGPAQSPPAASTGK
jgi:hypothetical protein